MSYPLKLWLIAFALIGAATCVARAESASETLAGRVTDSEGAPIGDVDVVLVELARETRTAADGSYSFSGVPAGRYNVLFHRLGYAETTLETVVGAGAASLDARLTLTPFLFDAINVTAARTPRPVLDTPVPVSFLSGPALERETSISLSHALEKIAGVRTVSTGGQIGKPMIRGLSGPRVLVLDDGHRMEDYSWSDEDGPSIDPANAGRVEVIRGPMSVLYGSDAIGGVANVLPLPLPEVPVGSEPGSRVTGGRLTGFFGSNSRETGAKAMLEGVSGGLGWRVSTAGRIAEALHTPDGELENTGFGALTGEAAIGLRDETRSGTLRYAHYGGEFKLLEAGGPPPDVPEGEEEGPERKASDDRLQLDGSLAAGPIRFELKTQFERHSLIELSDEALAPDTTAKRGAVGPGSGDAGRALAEAGIDQAFLGAGAEKAEQKEQEAFHLLLNTGTLDLLAHHGEGNALRGVVGLSGMVQSNDSRGPIYLVPDAHIRSGAAFVFEELRKGSWSFLAGVRGESRRVAADANPDLGLAEDETRSYDEVTADAGIVFRPVSGIALAGNAGRAWRAPTLFELFANGPQVAEARYLIGDADLRHEKSLDLDGSIRLERPLRRGEISVYRNRVEDFVVLRPTGIQHGDLPEWRYGQVDAVLTGVEASAEAQLIGPLWLSGRFDSVVGEEDASCDPLPLIPPPRVVLGAEILKPDLSWAELLRAGVEVVFVAEKRAHDAAPEERHNVAPTDAYTPLTDAYTLLNANVEVDRVAWSRPWEARLRVRNATNTHYRDFLSRYKAFALNPGIDVSLEIGTRF